MPWKKKLKAGDDAACPQCRKLVALVQTDGGSLVLRTHHVVATDEGAHGYDVKECGSSGYPPASPSEIEEGDNWQKGAPRREGRRVTLPPRGDVRAIDGDTIAEVIRNEAASPPPVRRGAVLNETLTIPDEQLRRFTADGGPRIDGMMTASTADEEPVLSLRDVSQRIYQDLDPLLIRLTGQPQVIDVRVDWHVITDDFRTADIVITARPCELDVTFNIVPSSMTSEATQRLVAQIADRVHDHLGVARSWSTDQAGLVALVLNAIRDTYIEVTGAPPTDAQVSTGGPDFMMDAPEVLTMRLEPGHIEVRVPIDPFAASRPDFPAEAARQAADVVRRALLNGRTTGPQQFCNAPDGHWPCACGREPGHDGGHRCVCSRTWPSPTREPEDGACP